MMNSILTSNPFKTARRNSYDPSQTMGKGLLYVCAASAELSLHHASVPKRKRPCAYAPRRSLALSFGRYTPQPAGSAYYSMALAARRKRSEGCHHLLKPTVRHLQLEHGHARTGYVPRQSRLQLVSHPFAFCLLPPPHASL